jgi:hypothetical protein
MHRNGTKRQATLRYTGTLLSIAAAFGSCFLRF